MDLPSVLGGLAQGFVDFGKSAVDLFGTGGAAFADLIQGTGTKNQDDFRKWLYQTDSIRDAEAKGLGTALNGAQTVSDYVIPGGVSKSLLFNAGQGALGGLADEFKTYGENYDLGRAGQRALVSAGAAGAGTGLANALKKSGSGLLQSGLAQGASRGALSGAINQGGYAAIDGGDIAQSALQGAGMGALLGGATGAIQDFMPKKLTPAEMALTDDERQARIANAQKQIDDIGPIRRFTDDPDELAKRARVNELQDAIRAYQSGYDNVQQYNDAMAAKRANKRTYTPPEAQYEPKIGEDMALNATQVPEGYTRLYRGLEGEFNPKYVPQVSDNGYGYESWSDSYDLAREYAGPNGNIYSVDVPNSRIADQIVTPDGERMPVVMTDKKAGMRSFDGDRFIDGKEYLLNVNDPLRQELTYSRVTPAKTLDATLANADMATNSVPDYLGDEKYNALVKKAKNYKSLDRFEKMNNPIKGSEIWGEKPTSIFQRDNRAVRVNMFPNEAAKGTGLTKQYLLNMFKDAYDQGITRIIPSYGIYTDEGASFMSHLADQGWLTETGSNGYKSYEIAPKIVEWEKTNPLADIYNAANGKTAKNLEATLSGADMAVNNPKLSPEQEAYFKESVIRDENGNLMPMYHGTRENFTVFGDNKPYDGSNSIASVGNWFTPSKDGAKNFADSIWYGENDPRVMETYLNMKNPKIYESVDNSKAIEPLRKQLQELELNFGKLSDTELYSNNMYQASMVQNMINQGEKDTAIKWLSDKGYGDEKAARLVNEIADLKEQAAKVKNLQDKIAELNYGDAYQRFRTDIYKMDGQTAEDANVGGLGMALNDKNSIKKYVDDLRGQGYDGIIIKGTKFDSDVMGGPNDQYVVFDSNQIKDINNLKPTSDPNILRALLPFIGLGGLGGSLTLDQLLNSKDEDKKKTNKRSA